MGKERPVKVEPWVDAFPGPDTAYRLVTGEYLDIHKAILQEDVRCNKASESRTDDCHGLMKRVKHGGATRVSFDPVDYYTTTEALSYINLTAL